jgi:hypothetical protein
VFPNSPGNFFRGSSFFWDAAIFVHVHGVRQGSDEVGDELPDDKTAWDEATIIAAELFRDIDGKFQPGQEWTLEMTDAQGRSFYSINISVRKLR